MLHLVPTLKLDDGSRSANRPAGDPHPYAEAVARLASIRHALRMVDPFGGGPASDADDDNACDELIASAWSGASKAKTRCFDRRTGRTAGAASAALDALLAEQNEGRNPNAAASQRVAEEIRAGLEDVSRLMLR